MKTELDAWQIRHQALEESHSIAQQTILAQEQEAKQFDEIVICTFWGGGRPRLAIRVEAKRGNVIVLSGHFYFVIYPLTTYHQLPIK